MNAASVVTMKKRTREAAKKQLEATIEKVRELTADDTKEIVGGNAFTGCTQGTSPAQLDKALA